MSTAAETLAKLDIHLSVNVQPFINSMQKICAAFTELALTISPELRASLADFSRAWQMPAPYRVKKGRGQRRNRRHPRRS